jgi:preprotein translocase subunit SecD
MLALTLARRLLMRTCRLAASWSGAAMVLVGLCGADPVNAQPQSRITSCPSFHEVHPTITAEEALRSGMPPGFEVYAGVDEQDDKQLLRRIPIVSSGEIAEAWTDLHFVKKNRPVVRFRFDAVATRNFGDFTTRNIHHSFAIVLNGRAISVLRIMEPILRGIGEIDGAFTAEEAKQLADRMNSGGCR